MTRRTPRTHEGISSARTSSTPKPLSLSPLGERDPSRPDSVPPYPCRATPTTNALDDTGLIKVEKGYEGRRPRTLVRITKAGRAALAAELDALAELVRRQRA